MGFDPSKTNPLIRQGLEGLKSAGQQPPMETISPDHDYSVWVLGYLACFFCIFITWKIFSNRKAAPVVNFSKIFLVALAFLFVRGVIDTFIGVYSNNAFNLIVGTISLSLLLFLCSREWYRATLIWGGIWLAVRGLISVALFTSLSDDPVEFILTMPLGVLPNFLLSYILPFVVSAFFFKSYFKDKDRIKS